MSNRKGPESCLICGHIHSGDCDPKILARIDSAFQRDPDTFKPRQRSEGERLSAGFDMLYGDDEDARGFD